ncbi:hypothetical protein HAX54_046542, partial [Datura stramonium]|nr:hypothetical protein [Datura stramonium]
QEKDEVMNGFFGLGKRMGLTERRGVAKGGADARSGQRRVVVAVEGGLGEGDEERSKRERESV